MHEGSTKSVEIQRRRGTVLMHRYPVIHRLQGAARGARTGVGAAERTAAGTCHVAVPHVAQDRIRGPRRAGGVGPLHIGLYSRTVPGSCITVVRAAALGVPDAPAG